MQQNWKRLFLLQMHRCIYNKCTIMQSSKRASEKKIDWMVCYREKRQSNGWNKTDEIVMPTNPRIDIDKTMKLSFVCECCNFYIFQFDSNSAIFLTVIEDPIMKILCYLMLIIMSRIHFGHIWIEHGVQKPFTKKNLLTNLL